MQCLWRWWLAIESTTGWITTICTVCTMCESHYTTDWKYCKLHDAEVQCILCAWQCVPSSTKLNWAHIARCTKYTEPDQIYGFLIFLCTSLLLWYHCASQLKGCCVVTNSKYMCKDLSIFWKNNYFSTLGHFSSNRGPSIGWWAGEPRILALPQYKTLPQIIASLNIKFYSILRQYCQS